MNRDGALVLGLLLGGNEENVVLAQGDVGDGAVEDALQIDAEHFQRAVGLHAMHHGAVEEGIFRHALGSLNQRAHGGDVSAQLIHTPAEHCTLQLHRVFVAIHDRIDRHGVAVGNVEGVHLELAHVEHGILPSGLAEHAHRLLVGVARESAGIFEQRAHALVFLHFVEHRALHLSCDVHHAVVGLHDDEIIVGQADVARLLAVEDIVIDIDRRYEFVVAIDLDVAQRSDVADALGHVERVEHGGEGGQRDGARRIHLAHHVHGDGARVAQRE